MKLFETLESLAKGPRDLSKNFSHAPEIVAYLADIDEAIETVKAMRDALKLATEHLTLLYPPELGDDYIVQACTDALRRAGD